jgi:5-methylcytosine-specific restriction protein A
VTLKPKCACGTKAYATQDAADRALAKVQSLGLRVDMPRRVAQCWHGQWHLEGKKKVDTGPDRDTCDLIVKRDDWTCACCGNSIWGCEFSRQHRVARGMGGTADPAINRPSNLITLCGSATSQGGCHLACEQRDPRLYDLGFWRKNGEDPAVIPVAHAVHGWVLLLDEEPWLRFPPEWGGAA